MRLRRVHERELASFADGRVWRLTRDRHFTGSIRALRERLEQTADDLGKVVRVVPDKLRPDRSVWVQFGDAAITTGEPCVCGSTSLSHLHRRWARCNECGRLLNVVEPKGFAQMFGPGRAADGMDTGTGQGSSPSAAKKRTRGKALDAFDEVELYRFSISEDVEQCFGVGRTGGSAPVLLSVRFQLEDGRRIPHQQIPGQWYYTLGMALSEQFGALIDPSDLEDGVRVSWKIDEDPGPQSHEPMEPAPG